MANPSLDDLASMSSIPGVSPEGDAAQVARSYLQNPARPGEFLEQRDERLQTQAAQVNRVRARDLGSRAIPTYQDETGMVQPVRDASGAALTQLSAGSHPRPH